MKLRHPRAHAFLEVILFDLWVLDKHHLPHERDLVLWLLRDQGLLVTWGIHYNFFTLIPSWGWLLPLGEKLIVTGWCWVTDHTKGIGTRFLRFLGASLVFHHALIILILLILISHYILKQSLPRSHALLLLLTLPTLLNHLNGHLLHLMIQHRPLFSLITRLNVFLEHLILKLRNYTIWNLKVNKSVTKVGLKAKGNLKVEGGFLELLRLDIKNFWDEFIWGLLLLGFGLGGLLVRFVLERWWVFL